MDEASVKRAIAAIGRGSLLAAAIGAVAGLTAGRGMAEDAGQRLLRAYPVHLERVEGNTLYWRDGTRMAIDDGMGARSGDRLLDAPDLKDMFHWSYPSGRWPAEPGPGADPGRPRNWAFFARMYGDCRKGEVERKLTEVIWLEGTPARQRIRVSGVNGIDQQLRKVSVELARLPERFRPFLTPLAGAYNCRPIAGTQRISPHGLGIAIDIAVRHSNYWQWAKPGTGGRQAWRNRIPREIVDAFERHGFIWGGRWSAFDTMHFEYRPELLPPPDRPGP